LTNTAKFLLIKISKIS